MTAKKSGAAHVRAFHPLFPVPADADEADFAERDIHWIYIYRGADVATKVYKFDELQDEEQLHAEYGGGRYTLKARDERRARWTASRELSLPGPSLPLDKNQAPAAAPVPAASPVVAPTMADGCSPGIRDALAIVAVAGPIVAQMLDASARRSEAQTQLLIQLVASKNSPQSEALQSALLQAAIQRNPGQETFALMQNAMQMGMQMGMNAGGGGGDGDISDVLEGMSQFVELEKIKAQRQAPQAPPPKPPTPKEGAS